MAPLSDRTFEIDKGSRYRLYRLFLTGLEVTQAVQHYGSASHLKDPADQGRDNSLRLVSRKAAWVRVYVAAKDLPPVTGTLEVWQRSSGFIWTLRTTLNPEPPGTVNAVENPDYVTERGTLASTLNFIIPADFVCGTLRLVASVSAGRWTDTLTTVVAVTLRQTLRVAGVMVAYDGAASIAPGAPNLKIAAPNIGELQAVSGRTLTLFPVEDTAVFRAAGGFTCKTPIADEAHWDALIAEVAKARVADGNYPGWVYYGLLPTGIPREGEITGKGGGGLTVTINGASGVMAHEVGHACGLKHAPSGDPSNPDPNYPVYEPYASGSIGEFGLDINDGHISEPQRIRDFMSYSAFKWISPYHHRRLIENPILNPKTVCVDVPWSRDVLWDERPELRPPVPEPPPFGLELPVFSRVIPAIDVISLIVRVERGRVSEVTHVSRTSVRPEIEHSAPTELVARLRGGDGQILSEGTLLRLPTSAGGCCHTESREPDTYVGQAFVRDVAPGASLEITDGKATLWERAAPKVPVTITSFDAKFDRAGCLTAAWTTKWEAAEFWLRQSRDGQMWEAVATGLTGYNAQLDPRSLPTGKIFLQLIAHDGFFTAVSKSIEVSIPDRSPDVAILHPREGCIYGAGQTLRLRGAVTSGDGRPVVKETCSWTIDGTYAGQGLEVWIAAPRAGLHEVTLTVADGRNETVVKKTTFLTVAVSAAYPSEPKPRAAKRTKPVRRRATKRT